MNLGAPLLLAHLRQCKRVLLAGAGGGFDVYAALPIARWLWRRRKTVHLANLSFSALATTKDADLAPGLYAIRPDTEGPDDYFPERILARFLASEGLPSTVHAFARAGVAQVHSAYVALCERLSIDAIVLVDGGTDILMFGDEAGLGTPVEDMTSLAAVGQIRLAQRHVACLGFGVDAYHGVCHAHFLENVATLEKDGAYHGAFSVPRVTEEGAFFLRAVEHAREAQPDPVSIVNGSIAHAMRGDFGDVQFTRRTSSSELFVNPLMAMYFTFDLMGVCKRNLYLRQLVGSPSPFHTAAIIEGFREDVRPRARRTIPHLPGYASTRVRFPDGSLRQAGAGGRSGVDAHPRDGGAGASRAGDAADAAAGAGGSAAPHGRHAPPARRAAGARAACVTPAIPRQASSIRHACV